MLIRHWVKINCFFVKYWKVSVLKSAKVKAFLWVHQLRFSLEQLNLKNKAVQKVLALLTHLGLRAGLEPEVKTRTSILRFWSSTWSFSRHTCLL